MNSVNLFGMVVSASLSVIVIAFTIKCLTLIFSKDKEETKREEK